jgi:hypothetical protein
MVLGNWSVKYHMVGMNGLFGLLGSYAMEPLVPTLASGKQAKKILATDNQTCKPVVKKLCQYISAYIDDMFLNLFL